MLRDALKRTELTIQTRCAKLCLKESSAWHADRIEITPGRKEKNLYTTAWYLAQTTTATVTSDMHVQLYTTTAAEETLPGGSCG